jgi:hypothetical protein
LATVYSFFYSLRAPRTFLGDRLPLFLLFTGSKNPSWRPSTPFFTLYGLQEPFLATVYSFFYSLQAPRTFLGDRLSSFLSFKGSKNPSWRPCTPFLSLSGPKRLFLATSFPIFYSLLEHKTFTSKKTTRRLKSGCNRFYFPLNTGFRFSLKACNASIRSSVGMVTS